MNVRVIRCLSEALPSRTAGRVGLLIKQSGHCTGAQPSGALKPQNKILFVAWFMVILKIAHLFWNMHTYYKTGLKTDPA